MLSGRQHTGPTGWRSKRSVDCCTGTAVSRHTKSFCIRVHPCSVHLSPFHVGMRVRKLWPKQPTEACAELSRFLPLGNAVPRPLPELANTCWKVLHSFCRGLIQYVIVLALGASRRPVCRAGAHKSSTPNFAELTTYSATPQQMEILLRLSRCLQPRWKRALLLCAPGTLRTIPQSSFDLTAAQPEAFVGCRWRQCRLPHVSDEPIPSPAPTRRR